MKKYIIQILAGAVVYLVFGWFIFDFLIGDFTDHNTTQLVGFKKSPIDFKYSFLIISCSAYACLITFILSYIKNTKNFKEGFIIAAVVGILVAIMTDSYWYASSNFYSSLKVVAMDIVCAGITVGVLGTFIVWINRTIK